MFIESDEVPEGVWDAIDSTTTAAPDPATEQETPAPKTAEQATEAPQQKETAAITEDAKQASEAKQPASQPAPPPPQETKPDAAATPAPNTAEPPTGIPQPTESGSEELYLESEQQGGPKEQLTDQAATLAPKTAEQATETPPPQETMPDDTAEPSTGIPQPTESGSEELYLESEQNGGPEEQPTDQAATPAPKTEEQATGTPQQKETAATAEDAERASEAKKLANPQAPPPPQETMPDAAATSKTAEQATEAPPPQETMPDAVATPAPNTAEPSTGIPQPTESGSEELYLESEQKGGPEEQLTDQAATPAPKTAEQATGTPQQKETAATTEDAEQASEAKKLANPQAPPPPQETMPDAAATSKTAEQATEAPPPQERKPDAAATPAPTTAEPSTGVPQPTESGSEELYLEPEQNGGPEEQPTDQAATPAPKTAEQATGTPQQKETAATAEDAEQASEAKKLANPQAPPPPQETMPDAAATSKTAEQATEAPPPQERKPDAAATPAPTTAEPSTGIPQPTESGSEELYLEPEQNGGPEEQPTDQAATPAPKTAEQATGTPQQKETAATAEDAEQASEAKKLANPQAPPPPQETMPDAAATSKTAEQATEAPPPQERKPDAAATPPPNTAEPPTGIPQPTESGSEELYLESEQNGGPEEQPTDQAATPAPKTAEQATEASPVTTELIEPDSLEDALDREVDYASGASPRGPRLRRPLLDDTNQKSSAAHKVQKVCEPSPSPALSPAPNTSEQATATTPHEATVSTRSEQATSTPVQTPAAAYDPYLEQIIESPATSDVPMEEDLFLNLQHLLADFPDDTGNHLPSPDKKDKNGPAKLSTDGTPPSIRLVRPSFQTRATKRHVKEEPTSPQLPSERQKRRRLRVLQSNGLTGSTVSPADKNLASNILDNVGDNTSEKQQAQPQNPTGDDSNPDVFCLMLPESTVKRLKTSSDPYILKAYRLRMELPVRFHVVTADASGNCNSCVYVGSVLVDSCQHVAKRKYLRQYTHDKSECEMWTSKMQDGHSIYAWHVAGFEAVEPHHVKFLGGKHRNRHFRSSKEQLLSGVNVPLPEPSLYSTAEFFLKLLPEQQYQQLRQTATALDGHDVRIGAACSGSDVVVTALKGLMEAISHHCGAPRLHIH